MDQEMVGGGLPLALHVMVASSSSAASVSLGASSHDGLATKGQGENNESSNRRYDELLVKGKENPLF